ncbi:MAG: hypothetical protein OQJ76_10155 [Rhodospirillales bacterium]|nr:hypothetical protein [Rhodospirillales bacterium]
MTTFFPPVAIIVFTDNTDIWWLRFLKRGFRHCFALVRVGGMEDGQWVVIDPLSHRMEIGAIPARPDFDPAAWYRARGHVVAVAPILPGPRRPAPWGPFTCVEAIKRLVGITDRRVVTPWGLWNKYKKSGLFSSHNSL